MPKKTKLILQIVFGIILALPTIYVILGLISFLTGAILETTFFGG